MQIPFTIEPGANDDGILLLVKLSDGQAPVLARALRGEFPHSRPRVLPTIDRRDYSHCTRLPVAEDELRRRWPRIQMQVLLGTGPPRPMSPVPAHMETPAPIGPAALSAAPPPSPPRPLQHGALTRPAAIRSERRPQPERTTVARASAAADAPDPRPDRVAALLDAGDLPAVIAAVPPDEPLPALRRALGVALARQDAATARVHLLYAWEAHERTPEAALWLARSHWQECEYDSAAAAYAVALDRAPALLEARDYAAIAELADDGSFEHEPEERQLAYLEAVFAQDEAPPQPEIAERLARRAIALGQSHGTSDRLLAAYRRLLDRLIDRRAGQAIADLLDEVQWQDRLGPRDRFDLLDEISDYLGDYPLLRDRLIAAYDGLLRQQIAAARGGAPIPDWVRDLYRAQRRFTRRDEALDAFRALLVEGRGGEAESAGGEGDAPAIRRLAGKRIALVGGHERTREHVRERLESWGVRVDEVAPPTNGRISEREILDKVHSSDLVLLIVTYMGHDMSTVVNNLLRRQALAGQVVPLDCRGMSGICRAIVDWAQSA